MDYRQRRRERLQRSAQQAVAAVSAAVNGVQWAEAEVHQTYEQALDLAHYPYSWENARSARRDLRLRIWVDILGGIIVALLATVALLWLHWGVALVGIALALGYSVWRLRVLRGFAPLAPVNWDEVRQLAQAKGECYVAAVTWYEALRRNLPLWEVQLQMAQRELRLRTLQAQKARTRRL